MSVTAVQCHIKVLTYSGTAVGRRVGAPTRAPVGLRGADGGPVQATSSDAAALVGKNSIMWPVFSLNGSGVGERGVGGCVAYMGHGGVALRSARLPRESVVT